MGREKERKKFNYRPPEADEVKQRASRNLSNYDGVVDSRFPVFKPKEGFNAVRILPNDADACPELSHWAMEVYIHSEIGPDHGKFLCLEKMRGEPCPICEARRDLDRRGRASKEDLDALKPYPRFIFWLIDRNDERTGPKWWEISPGFERDICNLSIDKRRGNVLALDHPDEGYDFEFDRRGTGMTTKYEGKAISRDKSYLHDKESQQEDWLEFISENPLPSILVWRDYDYIAQAFSGRGESKDRDLDDDDRRSRRSRLRDEEDTGGDERDSRRSRERTRDGGRGGDEEERPRSRSRSRDDDEPPRRRSVRDEVDDEEPPPSRERTRTRDQADDDEPPRRRSRDDDDDRSSRRSSRDDEPPRERERSRSRDDDQDEPPRRRREEPKDEEEPRRRREPDPEPEPEENKDDKDQGGEDDPPYEDEPPPRRRSARPDPEPEPETKEGEGEQSDVDAAREKLRRMAERNNKK